MQEFLDYRVSEFMSRSGIVVGPHTTLGEAERLFEKYDFNLLPVVDGNRFVGVFTKIDFLKAFRFQPDRMIPAYRATLDREVSEVMTRDPVTVSPDNPLTHVLERMVETRYRSFPVVEGQRLIGVISREDVVHALGRAARGTDRGAA